MMELYLLSTYDHETRKLRISSVRTVLPTIDYNIHKNCTWSSLTFSSAFLTAVAVTKTGWHVLKLSLIFRGFYLHQISKGFNFKCSPLLWSKCQTLNKYIQYVSIFSFQRYHSGIMKNIHVFWWFNLSLLDLFDVEERFKQFTIYKQFYYTS